MDDFNFEDFEQYLIQGELDNKRKLMPGILKKYRKIFAKLVEKNVILPSGANKNRIYKLNKVRK